MLENGISKKAYSLVYSGVSYYELCRLLFDIGLLMFQFFTFFCQYNPKTLPMRYIFNIEILIVIYRNHNWKIPVYPSTAYLSH